MHNIEREIIECLDRIIDHLWTKENRDSFLICEDLDEFANHIIPSVMQLDRWLSKCKHEQQIRLRQRKTS